jgi:diguanylate cyclase (GGDEF)-like protein/PAS domain S-box-containing protein
MRPFAATGWKNGLIIAIFATFALVSAASIWLSVRVTGGSEHRATTIEVASRQRTLAERYVKEILLAREGRASDPATIASVMVASSTALLEGGVAPGVNGDDDQTALQPAEGTALRNEFAQEQRIVSDLTETGEAVLAKRPVSALPQAAHEHISTTDPTERLRVLAALTSEVSLVAARSMTRADEANIHNLVTTQVLLGVGGLLITVFLALVLLATTRRQSAHFRSLALSSSDLVVVLGEEGCRYVSRSVAAMVGKPESDLYGTRLAEYAHEEDRALLQSVALHGAPSEFSFRMRNGAGEWRHLEAHTTDLRADRNLRGVVLNARDITDRVQLEGELTAQLDRDGFASHLSEALEMADEEREVSDVIERAAIEISEATPMELLLSDSSRANLSRAARNPSADVPGCPVKSPFSCVAVRRGSAVVFESSESLNACPQLRGRDRGPCSAVCVPVSFMGRALGVLHTTGPDGHPLRGEAVGQLTVLAGQAGVRIGTVRAFEKTQLQASTDGLTGLVNRRTAERELRELIKARHLFAVVIADLDKFKSLNDTHGHEAGDRALRLFAQTTKQTLRDNDLIARWGGEEFVIVLPELDRFQAVNVLDRLRRDLAVAHPGETARFTASFGVTDSGQADTLEELLSVADAGLYAAKQAGRDRAVVGDPLAVKAKAAEHPAAPEEPADGPIFAARGARPPIHEAADEEEPRPNGIQIR